MLTFPEQPHHHSPHPWLWLRAAWYRARSHSRFLAPCAFWLRVAKAWCHHLLILFWPSLLLWYLLRDPVGLLIGTLPFVHACLTTLRHGGPPPTTRRLGQ